MANGSAGLVIVGVAIGIVLAAQADRVDPQVQPEPIGTVTAGPTDRSPNVRESQTAGTSVEGPSTTTTGSLDTSGVIHTVGGGRVVALTFSGGPDPENTPQVLDVLERHDVRATFCVTGVNVRDNQAVVRDIAAAGHTLCSQGDSNDLRLAERDDLEIQRELRETVDAIEDAAPGTFVPFFRAPGGRFTPRLNQIAETYGHDPLGWSVDPEDWANPGATVIVGAVRDAVEPGSIIILHDGGGDRSDTVAALGPLIIELRAAGYEFTAPTPANGSTP